MPKGRYSGQKFKKLVANKMPAHAIPIIATVPFITSRKYSATTTAANAIRTIRSIDPIFFFILLV